MRGLRLVGLLLMLSGGTVLFAGCGSGGASASSGASIVRASAAPGGVRLIRLHAPVDALAVDGGRVAVDVSSDLSKLPSRILVWNVGTGKTINVSGRHTGGAGELAIAGTRVAWLIQETSNEEADVDVYTSSLVSPRERHVVSERRSGSQCGAGQVGYQRACAGTWLGGLVASGNRILLNRWTTDTSGTVSDAGLYELNGTKLGRPVVTGPASVEAAAADSKRIAVLQWRWVPRERTIHVYSSTGKRLVSVTPDGQPEEIALSGRNLVVLEHNGKLADYDARTGALRKTFTPRAPAQALSVQGDIAVYSAPARHHTGKHAAPEGAIYALDLATGKDRQVGRLPGQITLARIDSTGLVYANDYWTEQHGYVVELVFVPFKRVAAAVS